MVYIKNRIQNRPRWKTLNLLLRSRCKKLLSPLRWTLADLATQIPEPLVPHAVATPEALPLVTDSTPAPGPSAEQKIRLSTRWTKPPNCYIMLWLASQSEQCPYERWVKLAFFWEREDVTNYDLCMPTLLSVIASNNYCQVCCISYKLL